MKQFRTGVVRISLTVLGAVAAVSLGTFAATARAQSGSWATLPSVPKPHWEGTSVSGADGRVFVIAGLDASRAPDPSMHVFDPSTSTWSELAPLPTGRVDGLNLAAATVGADDRIYLFGIGPNRRGVYAYNIASNAWSFVTQLPHDRYNHSAVSLPDGRVYIIGGAAGQASLADLSVDVYNVYSGYWSTASPMPIGTYLGDGGGGVPACRGGDGRIYVARRSRAFFSYDTISDTWAILPDCPLGHSAGALARGTNGTIQRIGGDKSDLGTEVATATVDIYNPLSRTWTTGAPIPSPRTLIIDTTTSTGDGHVYVAGGVDEFGRITNTFFGFTPSSAAPIISDVYADASPFGAGMHWKTNVPASSTVEYGYTSAYGSSVNSGSPVLDHSIAISSLTQRSVYHYRVKSVDAVGRTVISSDYTFVTGQANHPYLTTQVVGKRRLASGAAAFDVLVNNTGGADALSVNVLGARIDNPASATTWLALSPVLPLRIASIGSGRSTTVTFTFPASAGSAGAPRTLTITGSYTDLLFDPFHALGFGGAFRVTMP